MGIFSFFSSDIAMDLGTANTLIYVKDKGIVLNEPSIVAYDKNTRKIVSYGREAKQMQGKEHKDIQVIRPLHYGVIADFEMAEGMIREYLKRASAGSLTSGRVVVAVPSGVTEVEKRAVRDSAEHAGAREVHLIEEPMAAAIGIGIDVMAPIGSMVIDIGGGTTEIAVIPLAGIVTNVSIRVAGDEFNNSIMKFFKNNYNLLIGERTAEEIKCKIGSAMPLKEEITVEVKGRDLVSGIPKTAAVSSSEIRDALDENIKVIIDSVKQSLEQTPPELAADILERGIMLSGGGALLKGLDDRIRMEVNLPVHVCEDPLTAVVRGVGKVVDNFNQYSKVFIKPRY